MERLNRRQVIRISGAAGIVGLAGCSGGGGDGGGGDGSDGGDGSGGDGGSGTRTTSGIESRTIEIGTLLPESGQLGGIGSTMADAAALAFDTVDEGSDVFSVDAQFGDSQSTPQDGLNAANDLANAGVPAVVGPAASNIHLQTTQEVFIPNEIVTTTPSATAVTITDLDDKDTVFRTTPSDALQGRVMAQYATDTLGSSTASTLFVNDDYGQQLAASFASAFENEGGTVQNEVSYEVGAASYTTRIQRAVQNDPDLLVVVGFVESGIQLFKDYYANFDPERDVMTVDGMNVPRLPKEVGRPMDNVVGTAPLADGPAKDTFDQMYRDAYDTGPAPFNAQTFDAAAVELIANAAAGENSGAAIKDQMRPVTAEGTTVTPENLVEGVEAAARGEDVNYDGASSRIRFDENGDLVAAKYEIWEYAPDTESGYTTVETVTVE